MGSIERRRKTTPIDSSDDGLPSDMCVVRKHMSVPCFFLIARKKSGRRHLFLFLMLPIHAAYVPNVAKCAQTDTERSPMNMWRPLGRNPTIILFISRECLAHGLHLLWKQRSRKWTSWVGTDLFVLLSVQWQMDHCSVENERKFHCSRRSRGHWRST